MGLVRQTIIGLPTETQSGQYLGRVKAVDFEPKTKDIARFYIRPALTKRLLCRQFIIHRDQVISLTQKKLVVEDTTIKLPVSVFRKATIASVQTK